MTTLNFRIVCRCIANEPKSITTSTLSNDANKNIFANKRTCNDQSYIATCSFTFMIWLISSENWRNEKFFSLFTYQETVAATPQELELAASYVHKLDNVYFLAYRSI